MTGYEIVIYINSFIISSWYMASGVCVFKLLFALCCITECSIPQEFVIVQYSPLEIYLGGILKGNNCVCSNLYVLFKSLLNNVFKLNLLFSEILNLSDLKSKYINQRQSYFYSESRIFEWSRYSWLDLDLGRIIGSPTHDKLGLLPTNRLVCLPECVNSYQSIQVG